MFVYIIALRQSCTLISCAYVVLYFNKDILLTLVLFGLVMIQIEHFKVARLLFLQGSVATSKIN